MVFAYAVHYSRHVTLVFRIVDVKRWWRSRSEYHN